MMGSFQAPMRSQPAPERPTLFLQKATPRNLGDLRSIRESENGSYLEISDRSEIMMFCMDEEYLGAQKLLKSDRLVSLLFLANPHERDENLEKAQHIQHLYDFCGDATYHKDICEAMARINKKHNLKPRHVLDQLKYERKKRAMKQKTQLQRKLQYLEDSDGEVGKENAPWNFVSPQDEDAVKPPKPRRLILKSSSRASSTDARPDPRAVPVDVLHEERNAVRPRQDDCDRLIGLPVKKSNADNMTTDGVCAGGFKNEKGELFLKLSWDGTTELEDVKFDEATPYLKAADKRNLLENLLTQLKTIDISTPQRSKMRKVGDDMDADNDE